MEIGVARVAKALSIRGKLKNAIPYSPRISGAEQITNILMTSMQLIVHDRFGGSPCQWLTIMACRGHILFAWNKAKVRKKKRKTQKGPEGRVWRGHEGTPIQFPWGIGRDWETKGKAVQKDSACKMAERKMESDGSSNEPRWRMKDCWHKSGWLTSPGPV